MYKLSYFNDILKNKKYFNDLEVAAMTGRSPAGEAWHLHKLLIIEF